MERGDVSEPDWVTHDLSGPVQSSEALVNALVGLQGEYRVAYASMAIPGFPAELRLGNVRVSQASGPLQTQLTTIAQQLGFSPVFHKWMERPKVGAGRTLTIFRLPISIPADVDTGLKSWRAECMAASGFLALLLDERVVETELLEDCIIFGNDGAVIGMIDQRRAVRTYEPRHHWLTRFTPEVPRFPGPPEDSARLAGALRWYQRAVTTGPSAEGVTLFWIAVEAVVPAAGGARRRNEVRAVEDALVLAMPGLTPSQDLDPTVGRLAGLRARIVHQGREADDELREGWYALEWITRTLLRAQLGVKDGWPLSPGELGWSWRDLSSESKAVWLEPPSDPT